MKSLRSVVRSPLADLPRRVLIGAVHVYRFFFSAWIGDVCRYHPSCSAYALGALEQHGALIGSGLAACRVLRCNPFCRGGHDPVPDRPLRLFGDWFGDPFRDRFGVAPGPMAPASSSSSTDTAPS